MEELYAYKCLDVVIDLKGHPLEVGVRKYGSAGSNGGKQSPGRGRHS